jgi:glycerol-3-phosphate dehydrogenase
MSAIEKVVIIGGGITGTAIARELVKFSNLQVTLLEKHPDISLGTTKANSGILHAGYDDDPKKYPVRASTCKWGNELWHSLTKELDIDVYWCGAMVVARHDNSLKVLEELFKRGEENSVPGLKLLDGRQTSNLEPNLKKPAGSLLAPTEGSIIPYEACIAFMENARDNGAIFRFSEPVIGLDTTHRGFTVQTSRAKYPADWVINAAGLYGDEISELAGIETSLNGTSLKIKPRRGEYFVFEREAGSPVNHIIFPTPGKKGKGVLVWKSPEGKLLIGPNAQDLPRNKKADISTSAEGLDEVWDEANELVSGIPPKQRCLKNFAGLRAELPHGDFVIERYPGLPGFINAIGMRSPGLASAPAVAKKVVEIMKSQGFSPVDNLSFVPTRKRILRFNELPLKRKKELISKDRGYAKVLCWCEGVTEGEVIEAIHRGARTVQGVSFRTGAGLGRCQSGSCLSRIARALNQELGIPLEKVELAYSGEEIAVGTKCRMEKK